MPSTAIPEDVMILEAAFLASNLTKISVAYSEVNALGIVFASDSMFEALNAATCVVDNSAKTQVGWQVNNIE